MRKVKVLIIFVIIINLFFTGSILIRQQEESNGENINTNPFLMKVRAEVFDYTFDTSVEENGKGMDFNIFPLREDEVNPNPSLLDEVQEHKVERGETLWDIANKYDIDIDTIIGANDISNMNKLQPGDVLTILPVEGIIYRIGPGENLSDISQKFNVSLNEITRANGISNPDDVQPRQTILLPGAKPELGYQDRLQQKLIYPVPEGTRISSYYGMRWGRMHEGVDFAVNSGTPIKAAGDGKVVFSGWNGGYGKTLIIEHREGLRTLYAHNSELLVSSGENVYRGQVVTYSGNTGKSTGPHLHFEVHLNGKPVDPLNYLK